MGHALSKKSPTLLCTTQWCSSNGLEESNGAFTFCFASCRIRYLLEKINALKLLANKGAALLHRRTASCQTMGYATIVHRSSFREGVSTCFNVKHVCANESVPYIHLDVRSMCDLSIGSTTLEIYRKLYINHPGSSNEHSFLVVCCFAQVFA